MTWLCISVGEHINFVQRRNIISIGIVILILLGVSQGLGSGYFTSSSQDSSISMSENETIEDPLVEWWYISEGEGQSRVDDDVENEYDLENGETVSIQYNAEISWHTQKFWFDFGCSDGETGELGVQNMEDEMDSVHITIRTNNGQEWSDTLDCDGDWSTIIENAGNSEFNDWYLNYGYQSQMRFHNETDILSVIAEAPLCENMYPVTVEITAETRGDTEGYNQDNDLSFHTYAIFEIHTMPLSSYLGKYHESEMEHTHYNGTS